jgi:hypothetical protein
LRVSCGTSRGSQGIGSFGREVDVVGMSLAMLRVEMVAVGCGRRRARKSGGLVETTKDGEPAVVGHG